MTHTSLPPLSADRVAFYLGISTRSVRRLVDRGLLRSTRVGAQAVYLWPDVLACAGRGPMPEDREPPRLLTLHEVADRLGCAPARVRELTAGGLLPSTHIGGVQRWWQDQVETLARGGQRDDPAA